MYTWFLDSQMALRLSRAALTFHLAGLGGRVLSQLWSIWRTTQPKKNQVTPAGTLRRAGSDWKRPGTLHPAEPQP